MPATDAEMTAYRWGQGRSFMGIGNVLPEGATLDEVARQLGPAEMAALVRIGRRAFRYWAERGATGTGPR